MHARYMKSGEFAALCGTTKDTLIHYDALGLLKPARVEANGYRLYSTDDYYRFIVIRTLTRSGLSLEEVGRALHAPGPQALAPLIAENRRRLDERIAQLETARRLLDIMERQACEAAAFEDGTVHVVDCPEETLLVMGGVGGSAEEVGSPQATATINEGLVLLRSLSPEAELAPYGFSVAPNADFDRPLSYRSAFYVVPAGMPALPATCSVAAKPAGTYASIGYVGPWHGVRTAYRKLADQLATQRLDPCGNYYEIARFRLLDIDLADSYRCTVSVRIATP